MMDIRSDAVRIMEAALRRAQPDEAVRQALSGRDFSGGRLILVAVGKAAFPMARAALELVPVDRGIVITKYGHALGALDPLEIYEAGHPVPDENGFRATARALEMVKGLNERDHVLMLISGGGSALFELPLVAPKRSKGLPKGCSAPARTSARSTQSGSGCPPSRAGNSRSPARLPASRPSRFRTCWATRRT